MRFIDLKAFAKGGVDRLGQRVEVVEKEVAEVRGFHNFEPGITKMAKAKSILIGYAYWSRNDLILLDELSDNQIKFQGQGELYVFDFGVNCITQDDYDRYFPLGSIKSIIHTPVVCWFENGSPTLLESGPKAAITLRDKLLNQ